MTPTMTISPNDSASRPNKHSSPNPKFWDRIANKYARSPIKDQEAYERKLSLTQEHLRADMEVLEFGCGTGSTAIAHAPHVNHILATDISAKMLEIARTKSRDAGVNNITFKQATLESTDADYESFDTIMGLSLIHI